MGGIKDVFDDANYLGRLANWITSQASKRPDLEGFEGHRSAQNPKNVTIVNLTPCLRLVRAKRSVPNPRHGCMWNGHFL